MRKFVSFTAVSIGTCTLLVNLTAFTVALPDISRDLSASLSDLQWILNVYPLALASTLLGAGSLADRFGHRLLYVSGAAVFGLASLICAGAQEPAVLIAARGFQGIGAAAILATTVALLDRCYSGRARGVAFGLWGAVSGVAATVGPILGGLFTERLRWRSIFAVSLALSLLAIVLTLSAVKESSVRRGPIDRYGTALFTLSAASFVYGLVRASEEGWTRPVPLVAFAASAVGLLGFLALEWSLDDPILDLHLFGRPAFAGLMVAAASVQAGAFSTMAFISIWLQTVANANPIEAGWVFVPLSVTSLVCSVSAGWLFHDRVPPGLLIAAGMVLVATGNILQAFVRPDSSSIVLLPGLAVIGAGIGIAMPALASATLAAAPSDRRGMAGAGLTTFQELGYVLGVGTFGAVFAAGVQRMIDRSGPLPNEPAANLLIDGSAAGQRSVAEDVTNAAFSAGLRAVLLAAAAIALLGAVLTVWLTWPRPANGKHERHQ